MKPVLTFFCFLLTFSVSAQTLKGSITDAKTGEALPYVNVGVIGKNIGTVSDDDGTFTLTIPAGHENDTARVSMIGYKDMELTVAALHKHLLATPEIKMKPYTIEMEQVVITNKKEKQKLLGNKTESKTISAGFTSDKLGHEIGMVMKIKGAPSLLKTFSASIASEDNPPVKLRLNFYSVKDGQPHELIINKNILVNVPKNASLLVVDLTPYNIMVEDDFFVSLEWLEEASKRIQFSAGLLAQPFFARQTSQGNWYKVSGVGIGFTVDTVYWK